MLVVQECRFWRVQTRAGSISAPVKPLWLMGNIFQLPCGCMCGMLLHRRLAEHSTYGLDVSPGASAGEGGIEMPREAPSYFLCSSRLFGILYTRVNQGVVVSRPVPRCSFVGREQQRSVRLWWGRLWVGTQRGTGRDARIAPSTVSSWSIPPQNVLVQNSSQT